MTADEPLRSALAQHDLQAPERARARFDDLFRLLQAWRGRGITGFSTPEALAEGYFVESLALGPYLPATGRRLDVGSGAGTPALPLAIVEDETGGAGPWTLLEPRRQAAGFLGVAVETLGLENRVKVERRRLNDYLNDDGNAASMRALSAVTLRAVRLSRREWTGLAASLSPEAVVIWPTSLAARARADLPSGLFREDLLPARRGIVWVGRPSPPAAGRSSDPLSRPA